MSSLTSALRIATSGMQTNQSGLGTVSHNIVNANTAGYTRQTVQQSQVAYNGFGAGVDIQAVGRTVDKYVQTRTYQQESNLSYAKLQTTYLGDVQSKLTNANGSGSLESLVSGFYGSVSSLSNDVGNISLKTTVVQQASLLADTIKDIRGSLDSLQVQADQEIDSQLSTLNTALARISELNGAIAAGNSGLANGSNTNDLEDERDRQVAIVSGITKVQVGVASSNGAVRLTTENGRRLVDESGYVQYERINNPGGFADIGFRNVNPDGRLSASVSSLDTNTLTSGSLKGLVDVRDSLLPNQIAQMDTLARGIMDSVNRVASAGSSIPPQRTLTSAGTTGLATSASDIIAGLTPSVAGSSFNVSITDASGNPLFTTVGNSSVTPAVPATPITIPNTGPYSLDDLVADINGNAALAGAITASTVLDAAGRPVLQLTATGTNNRVVLDNVAGDALGTLGMNTFFTGTDSSNMAVKASIAADPSRMPVAQMRADGGVSSLNNETALALAQLADTKQAFGAVGGLVSQTVTTVGFANSMLSNLAVNIQDARSRESFSSTMLTQLQAEQSSVSGVNLNEELSTMLVYQQGFQASARLVNVVNSLLEELVNIAR